MKKIVSYLVLIFSVMSFNSIAQQYNWAKCFDGNYVYANGIAKDNLGNNFVVGNFDDYLSVDGHTLTSFGSSDIFIAKFDNAGNVIWLKKAGGILEDVAKDVSVDDAGNIFITGCFTGSSTFDTTHITSTNSNKDMFVAKYSSTGNCLWVKQAVSYGAEQGEKIKVMSDQKILITGTYTDNVFFGSIQLLSFNNGFTDSFMASMDASGTFLWAEEVRMYYWESANGVSYDVQGNMIFSGTTQQINSDKDRNPNNTEDIFTNIYLNKYGPTGNLIFSKILGGLSDDYVAGVVADSKGNVFVAGTNSSNANFDTIQVAKAGAFLAKFNPQGSIQWIQTIPGTRMRAKAINSDEKNNLYVTGEYQDTLVLGDSIFINNSYQNLFYVMYDSIGKVKWADTAGGPLADYSYGITAGPKVSTIGKATYPFGIGDSTLECGSSFIAEMRNNFLELLSPNGGEYFKAGTQDTIFWTSYLLDSLEIQFSSNNGISWMTVGVNATGGAYIWNIPELSSDKCKIRLVYNNPLIPTQIESDSNFIIYTEGNYSLYMDGIEDYVGDIIENQLGSNDEFTVEVWIKPESDSHCGVINRADNSSIWSYNLYTAAGTTNWGIKDGEPPSYTQSQGPSLNQWHHIAVTKDNSGKLNVFIDGIKTSTANYRLGFMTPSTKLRFGKYLDYGAGFYYKGFMTRVRISKIIRYSSSFIPPIEYSLDGNTVGQWDFRTGVGDSLFDASVHGRNGKIYGATWSTEFPQPTGTLELTSPNGGENWQVGSSHNITWNHSNVINVKIEYTTDSGTSWNQIVSTTPGTTGSYSWTIPNAVSTNCKVRITDVSNGLITDQSDAIFTISVATSAIYLDYPNGGENWVVGNSYSIRWTQTGVANVKLEYTGNNGTNWYQITASTSATTGSYSWTIPNTISTNCKVKITDVSNSSISDQSDASFTISAAPVQSITVSSPNGGENWTVGSSHNITWTQSGVTNVKLEYTSNNGTSWNQIIASTSAAPGSYSWIIPNTPSTNCRVRITDVSNGSITDQSNNTFTVSAAPSQSVTVTSPNGSENWQVGSTQDITWTHSNVSNIKIEYTTNNGTNWSQIINSTPASSGTYSWTIPNAVSNNCRVKITNVMNSQVTDQSNSVFTISPAPIPSVTISSPNGGEKWFVGAQYSITWNSANIETLKLDYSMNGGTDWILIEASVAANLGSYIWTIPNTPSSDCIVRISSTVNSTIFDVSNAGFAIAEVPAITLTSPNGGEKWVAGKQYSITWSSVAVSKLKAEYSADNGTQWIPIADSVAANLGSYIWTVPNTESNNCLVRLTGVDEPTVSDLSDSPFSIELERNLTLTSPAAGETYTSGQTMSIRWTSLNLETVDIYYSADNGTYWQPVSDSINASTQLFEWLIPETNSNQVKVRVVYTQRPDIRSEVAGTITILPSPKVVLQSNLSGAFMKAGSRYTIRWFVENVSAVNILYTSDGGSVWNEIGSNIPATVRSYEWVIPALNSAQCRLKTVSADDPTLFSISESQFTIYTYSETVNLSHSWQFGDIKDISNYRLISIPGYIAENLGYLMPGKYLNDWNAYWDNGSDANYQIQYDGGDRFNLQPGRGFWVLSKDPVNLTRQIAAASIDSTITTSIPLHAGWNIIGNPFNRDIKWSDVVSRNGLAQNSLIYSWSGVWTFPATMEPFKGYYFLNGDSRANLRLSYPVGQALSKTGIPEMIRLPDRRVRISFGQTEVVAGFSSSASTGEDTCDYRLPAVSFSKSEVSLVSNNDCGVERHFIVEAQNDDSLGNSFRLKVRNTTERSSEISFALDKLDAGESVWLIDEKYGEFLDLRVKDKFMIAPQNDARYFTLLIGSESFINSKKQEYLPKEYALYQNYPNPFNPETSIKYALPEDADIRIELFDILGNRVQTIYDGAQKAGMHTIQFEPSGLASGVYLYRLVAGKTMLVKKMVYLK